MTDERLRDLERRFKESGSPEDEVAWLQARVRAGERLDWDSYSRLADLNVNAAADYLGVRVERGELSQEKLELSAYCSHEPARLLLGEDAPEVPASLEEWSDELPTYGLRAVGEAAIRSIRYTMNARKVTDPELLSGLSIAADWVECP